MACHNCKPVAAAANQLLIGSIAESNGTAVCVVVENMGNGQVRKQDTTIEGNNAQVDLTDPSKDFYAPGAQYKFWVTDPNLSDSLNDKKPITMSTETADCAITSFVLTLDGSGAPVVVDDQTLELA